MDVPVELPIGVRRLGPALGCQAGVRDEQVDRAEGRFGTPHEFDDLRFDGHVASDSEPFHFGRDGLCARFTQIGNDDATRPFSREPLAERPANARRTPRYDRHASLQFHLWETPLWTRSRILVNARAPRWFVVL